MVVSIFSMSNKNSKMRFFEKNFLLANVKPDIVLGIFFLTINNANVNFKAQNLQWRSYTTAKVLLTIRKIKLIEKKKFIIAILYSDYKTFVVYIAIRNISLHIIDKIHSSSKAQIVYLKADEISIEIPSKYANFIDIFSPNLTTEFLKFIDINNHAIKLADNW